MNYLPARNPDGYWPRRPDGKMAPERFTPEQVAEFARQGWERAQCCECGAYTAHRIGTPDDQRTNLCSEACARKKVERERMDAYLARPPKAKKILTVKGKRRNPRGDVRLREIERRARAGDLDAQAALATTQLRAGVITPPSHQLAATGAPIRCPGCNQTIAYDPDGDTTECGGFGAGICAEAAYAFDVSQRRSPEWDWDPRNEEPDPGPPSRATQRAIMAAHDAADTRGRRETPPTCQMTERGWRRACGNSAAGLDPFSGTPLCAIHLEPLQREFMARGRRDLWLGRVRLGNRMRPPRMNPPGSGDDRLRALERAAAQGDPAAAAALDTERRRRGLPVDERRQYVADLTAAVADSLVPADYEGSARHMQSTYNYAVRDRANVAKALRAVLKAEKIRGVSVTTPRYSMANHVEVTGRRSGYAPGGGMIPQATYAALLRLFFGEETAAAYENVAHPWAQDLALYVNNREDRSDGLGDYHHPGGPSLPWWAADTYMRALAAAATKAKPRAVATARRRGRLSCSACGRGASALYRAGDSDVCRRCYGR